MGKAKQLLVVCPFDLPFGDAGATRMITLARALADKGASVELCGMGARGSFDKVRFNTMRVGRSRAAARISWRIRSLLIAKKIRGEISHIDALLVSFLDAWTFRYVKRICISNHVPLFVDCTEWFSPSEFVGSLDIRYIDHNRLMTKEIQANVKVLAISSFLADHFREKGCKTMLFPSVLDVEAMPFIERKSWAAPKKIVVTYAGSPGKKDALGLILEAVCSLPDEVSDRLEFRFFGFERTTAANYLPSAFDDLPSNVLIMGRVSRDRILQELARSDFTILLRDPHERFAKAGMPTKITESLGCGVPVIANITSDLGEYLQDGENAFIIDSYSAQSVSVALKRASEVNYEMHESMRNKARLSSLARLDYRNYESALDEFFWGDRQ